jgi:hypothetical protein
MGLRHGPTGNLDREIGSENEIGTEATAEATENRPGSDREATEGEEPE